MKKEAVFWKSLGNSDVQCFLCAHSCKIKKGKRGICGVRENENGQLFSLIYGSCSSIAVDPIEKKPLYHFFPGTQVLSFGTVGCNFQCKHCQNYGISTASPDGMPFTEVLPEEAVAMAQDRQCKGIAWTYNEPAIWHEYTFDTAKLAKQAGLYTVYVTNGYLTEEPLREIAPYLDAMNVDVKAFHDGFYKKTCKAKLAPVLQTCERAVELGIHMEVTYLVIPGYNDSDDEIMKFCKWVVEKLGEDVAVHFSRFHPDYKMLHASVTPIEQLKTIYALAKEAGVLYPYLGNVPHGSYEDTVCPQCGNVCVERYGFSAQLPGINNGQCARCSKSISIIGDW